MSGFKEPSFADRQKAAQQARQNILNKFKAQPGPDDPEVKQRQAEREAQAAARAKAKEAREAAKAEAKAREEEAAAAAAAQLAREKEEEAARQAALEAEAKAKRDARYAARKSGGKGKKKYRSFGRGRPRRKAQDSARASPIEPTNDGLAIVHAVFHHPAVLRWRPPSSCPVLLRDTPGRVKSSVKTLPVLRVHCGRP